MIRLAVRADCQTYPFSSELTFRPRGKIPYFLKHIITNKAKWL